MIATLPGDDAILCMITSKAVRDSSAISLARTDFAAGGLPRSSSIRSNHLFTADLRIVMRSTGNLIDDVREWRT